MYQYNAGVEVTTLFLQSPNNSSKFVDFLERPEVAVLHHGGSTASKPCSFYLEALRVVGKAQQAIDSFTFQYVNDLVLIS